MKILDASAFLAGAFGEPGGDSLVLWPELAISSVNWAEVLQKIRQKDLSVEAAFGLMERSQVQIVAFEATQAAIAAALFPVAKPFGLSLADRACLALATVTGGGVLTADRIWSRLPDLGIEITLIR